LELKRELERTGGSRHLFVLIPARRSLSLIFTRGGDDGVNKPGEDYWAAYIPTLLALIVSYLGEWVRAGVFEKRDTQGMYIQQQQQRRSQRK
jgi:hypothetical protein